MQEFSDLSSGMETYEAALAKARAAYARADYADAEERFADLVRRNPDHPSGLMGLGHTAQARGDWAAAVDLFTQCIARFPDQPRSSWRLALAYSLRRLGRPDMALEALQPLRDSASRSQMDYVMFAGAYGELGNWTEAVAHWQHALGVNGELRPEWNASYADALTHLGRLEEAIRRLRETVLADSSSVHLVARYLYLLGQRSRSHSLIEEAFNLTNGDDRVEVRLACAALAARINDIERLQVMVDALLPRLEAVSQCERLFSMIPAAFDGWARTSRWLALEQKLNEIRDGEGDETTLAAVHVLRMRLKLGLRDHPAFLQLHATNPDRVELRRRRYAQLAAALTNRPFPNHDAEKVFGIGLPKTGTTSLHTALETLGYLSAHYLNEFTAEVLTPNDYFLFDAITDSPACLFFESNFHNFPDSRFIYTTRPLEGWVRSLDRHHERAMGTAALPSLRAIASGFSKTRYGSAPAMFSVPLLYRHASPQDARQHFETRLFDFFSGERRNRLLVLDIFSGDGWAELCGFLGRAVPQATFPRENVAQH